MVDNPLSPSDVFRRRLREIREDLDLSRQKLSDRLRDNVGHPIDALTLAGSSRAGSRPSRSTMRSQSRSRSRRRR